MRWGRGARGAGRTPDEVGAVVQGCEPGWELAGADHGREDDLAAVVDAVGGDGDALGGCGVVGGGGVGGGGDWLGHGGERALGGLRDPKKGRGRSCVKVWCRAREDGAKPSHYVVGEGRCVRGGGFGESCAKEKVEHEARCAASKKHSKKRRHRCKDLQIPRSQG